MMCSYLMSKRKMLMVYLVLLFAISLTFSVKTPKGRINQYPVSSNDDVKKGLNDELLYKSDPLVQSHEMSKLNTSNHLSSVKISGFQVQNNIDLSAIDPSAFVSIWNTSLTSDGSTGSEKINLPLEASGSYDFNMDWGDGTNDVITTWNQVEVTHTYSSEGVYTIIIEGTLVG